MHPSPYFLILFFIILFSFFFLMGMAKQGTKTDWLDWIGLGLDRYLIIGYTGIDWAGNG